MYICKCVIYINVYIYMYVLNTIIKNKLTIANGIICVDVVIVFMYTDMEWNTFCRLSNKSEINAKFSERHMMRISVYGFVCMV